MKCIVLAGGSGTRLWPLSRKNYPKQFLKLNSKNSLLQGTVERLLKVFSHDEIIVMTNSEYKFHVMSDLSVLPGFRRFHNIILEPVSKNTAPAIALAMKYCLEKLGCNEGEVLFIFPSDHIIRPPEKFARYIRLAEEAALQGHIVTFGVKPARPETGYGYIKAKVSNRQQAGSVEFLKVEKFAEKPDADTARQYVSDGSYYWNSGMFSFRIDTMMKEFARHAPEIREMLNRNFNDLVMNFDQMPEISIDYAVAEKSDRMVIMSLDIYWNDIGSWDSLYDAAERDEKGNMKVGDVITVDTRDSLIISDGRLVSTIGMEDCLIVDAGDAVLVAKRGEAQKVREVVSQLNSENRKEALEHLTTYRPWGSYTVLEEGERYKIKRIVVNPGARLSLQMHYHRSEHWVVVKGAAKVMIGEKEVYIHENESAYVAKSALHRLENPGKVPLEIIEVQNGEYVGEDDIVRVDDAYGRQKENEKL